MTAEVKRCRGMEYILTYPSGFSKEKRYPVIIFLHGAGTAGSDINKLKENPFYKIIGKYESFDFVTAAPQCNLNTWFDMFGDIIGFAEEIASLGFADSDRVYGMGASMGGYGIWQLAMSRPNLFAAIVPICGGGMYWNAARLKNVPVWAFHGESDATVDKAESVKMVEAVNRAGGNAKLTIYPQCGHDVWSQTYSNNEVFEWLKSKKRACANADCENKFNGSKIYG